MDLLSPRNEPVEDRQPEKAPQPEATALLARLDTVAARPDCESGAGRHSRCWWWRSS